MNDSVPIRHLEKAADNEALALTMFLNLVYGTFNRMTVFWNQANVRTTSSGKDFQSIRYGEAAFEEHAPGEELLGLAFATDEVKIPVDPTIVSHSDVAFEDDDLSHFDILRPLAEKQGAALANTVDERIAIMCGVGAQTAALAGIHPGGQVVTVGGADCATAFPASATGAEALRDAIWEGAQKLDEDNLPLEDRTAVITPYLHRILGFGGDNIWDRDYGVSNEGISERGLGRIGGMTVMTSNSVPITDRTLDTSVPTKYRINNEDTCALFFQGQDWVHGVQPRPMRVVIENDERRRTTFIKSEHRTGWLPQRTEACGIIEVDGV